MRRDADETGEPLLLGPIERRGRFLNLRLGVVAGIGQEADPPEIDVVQPGLFHSLHQALRELLGRAPFGKAALLDVPRVSEVHFVAAARQCLGVGQDFLAAAGIDIVDAPLDAASEHVAAVLLELRTVDVHGHPTFRLRSAADFDDPFPMPAQGYSRDHQPGTAAAPVLHVAVVVENLSRVILRWIARIDDLRGHQARSRPDCGGSAVAEEFPASEFAHGSPPLLGRWNRVAPPPV